MNMFRIRGECCIYIDYRDRNVDREWIGEERKGVWNYTDATNLKVSVRDAVSFFCVNIFIYFKRKLENQ